jgi:hypothetical protein
MVGERIDLEEAMTIDCTNCHIGSERILTNTPNSINHLHV